MSYIILVITVYMIILCVRLKMTAALPEACDLSFSNKHGC